MKKLSFSVITLLVLSFMFIGNMAVQASVDGKPSTDYQGKTGFLPDISEFKIDIEKPKKEIHNSLNTAKPLRESFHQAIEEIQTSLEAVKQNRTPETQRQLHNVFSKNIFKIEKKMVGVTKEKYRIKDSFEEIDREFKRAKGSLDSKLQKLSEDTEINSKMLEELQKKSGELARRYLENPTDELKSELDMLRKQRDSLSYSTQQIPGQVDGIKKAVAMLDKQGTYYHQLGNHVDHLLEKLDVQRQKFASVAEVYNMLVGISETTWSFSGDTTPTEWYAQVEEVWNIVDSFSGIMDEVTDELTKFSSASIDGNSIEIMEVNWNDDLEEWIKKQAETYY
ncbi:MAG: Chromosome partition protein Smc [Candidatus Scalindua rubra]|uniref:Chromosome partition protein Smc n=1 Tax=Candidatus Scalindua rubra TaxID=1872076 RepID=A0A1E3XGP8_9BACT|nr:MAG: Chromosome partition protein Smc [Candidatus Scalindua rubra]